jgi:hypothetical protein
VAQDEHQQQDIAWQLVVSSDGNMVAIVQDTSVVIRSGADGFTGTLAVLMLSSPYPTLPPHGVYSTRPLAWSEAGRLLAVSDGPDVLVYGTSRIAVVLVTRLKLGDRAWASLRSLGPLRPLVAGLAFIGDCDCRLSPTGRCARLVLLATAGRVIHTHVPVPGKTDEHGGPLVCTPHAPPAEDNEPVERAVGSSGLRFFF